MKKTITLDLIADYLLEENMLLTGLELYQECLERGLVIPQLRQVFGGTNLESNLLMEDKNYHEFEKRFLESKSLSKERNNCTEESGETSLFEKFLILEYELRQERQTVQDLRKALSKQIQISQNTRIDQEIASDANLVEHHHRRDPRLQNQLEVRIINYSINKYLLLQGYKMAAITLASESGHDVNKWITSSYGLSIPEPPSVLEVYRYFYGESNSPEGHIKHLYKLLEESLTVNDKIKQELEEKNRIISSLQKKLGFREEDEFTTSLKFSDYSFHPIAIHSAIKTEMLKMKTRVFNDVNECVKSLTTQASRDYSILFCKDQFEYDDNTLRIFSQLEKIKNANKNENNLYIEILTDSLPEIVSGTVLKKRCELIPLIVTAILLHSDGKRRSELVYMLLNLVRAPTLVQRRIIMDGCIFLSHLNVDFVVMQLFPLITESMSSSYEEKRTMCAEMCGWLALRVNPELRFTLILSILQQLLQDASSMTRVAALINLSRILAIQDEKNLTENECEFLDLKKCQQLVDLVKRILRDPDPLIVQISHSTLLTVFVDFLGRFQMLEGHFLPNLISELNSLIVNYKNHQEDAQIESIAELIVSLAPILYENLLIQLNFHKKRTNRRRIFNDQSSIANEIKLTRMISAFDEEEKRELGDEWNRWLMELESDTAVVADEASFNRFVPLPRELWRIWDWMVHDLVPSVISMALSISVKDNVLVDALCNILLAYTLEFGEKFTEKVVCSPFVAQMQQLGKKRSKLIDKKYLSSNQKLIIYNENCKDYRVFSNMEKANELSEKRVCMCVIYYTSVVVTFGVDRVAAEIKRLIVDIACGKNEWIFQDVLDIVNVIRYLIRYQSDCRDRIFEVLSELVVNKKSAVRMSIIYLYANLISILTFKEISEKLVPALATLANDSDLGIRCGTIDLLGSILVIFHDPSTQEKIKTLLQSQIEEGVPTFNIAYQFAKTFKRIVRDVLPAVRDTFILKTVLFLLQNPVQTKDIKKQNEYLKATFDIFAALGGLPMEKESLNYILLPALKLFEGLIYTLPSEKKNAISNAINVVEQTLKTGHEKKLVLPLMTP